jgi:dihydrodipicolinate synthase/N-acetylneuraminate lyase
MRASRASEPRDRSEPAKRRARAPVGESEGRSPSEPSRDVATLRRELLRGLVIPAHPLALTEARRFDERRQVALTRYYCDAGAGGIAVGVHTTQFAIRDPAIGLFEPVLQLAQQTVTGWCTERTSRPVMVAGVVGKTAQAVREAEIASSLGYDAALLSLAALRDAGNHDVLDHCKRIAAIIPIVGFYLQPAVGGRVLDRTFWRGFFDIDRVVAVKVAPFDRYRTLDVTTALADSGRDDVALYTGNDDAIVTDLLMPFPAGTNGRALHFAGGLLGQWAVWTKRAVDVLRRCHDVTRTSSGASDGDELVRLLAVGAELTDANAALFDPAHQFAGCIPGIHEILRRQGLLAGRWCLDPHEDLSPGQMEEIDRVIGRYPHLRDDEFVKEHLHRWLS